MFHLHYPSWLNIWIANWQSTPYGERELQNVTVDSWSLVYCVLTYIINLCVCLVRPQQYGKDIRGASFYLPLLLFVIVVNSINQIFTWNKHRIDSRHLFLLFNFCIEIIYHFLFVLYTRNEIICCSTKKVECLFSLQLASFHVIYNK